MNKRGLSRMLSVLLLLVMVVSMLPVSAYADSTTATLVTDISSLSVGDKVVVIAKDYDFALGTNQKTNNREAVAITKTDGNVTLTDTVQVLTLEAGTKEGTFALNTGSGYLYAASSSSNHLKTQSTLSDDSSWTVEIASDGTATIKAQGTNTRNWLRYNPNNGTPIFSCYASGQNDICIYKVGSGVVDPDPEPIETVATPTASVASGAVAEGTKVAFSCETAGAEIYYKVGEGEYTKYADSITVTAAVTYTVKAVLGELTSEEAVFTYTVKDPFAVDTKYSVYKLVDKPTAGDIVLILNPNSSRVLSSQPLEGSTVNFTGVSTTPDGYYIYVDVANTADIEWAVDAGSEGFYTFTQGEKKLSSVLSGNYVALSVDPANETDWALDTCSEADNTYFIRSELKNADEKSAYLEWYSKFCVYGSSDPLSNINAFGMAFYKLVREGKVTSVAAPEAAPAAGEVAKGTEVTLSCATEGASILYKTAADAEFAEYTAPIVIDEDTTITAKAVKEGLADSEEVSFAYTVKVNTKTADYTETIADGDKVVIYYPVAGKVMGTEEYLYNNKMYELTALDGSLNTEGDILTYSEGTAELNVVVDENGKYSFVTDEGKYLYLDGTKRYQRTACR